MGEYDPETGLYEDYLIPDGLKPKAPEERGLKIVWRTILENWTLVVADFAGIYHFPPSTVTDWVEFRTLVFALASHEKSLLRQAIIDSQ